MVCLARRSRRFGVLPGAERKGGWVVCSGGLRSQARGRSGGLRATGDRVRCTRELRRAARGNPHDAGRSLRDAGGAAPRAPNSLTRLPAERWAAALRGSQSPGPTLCRRPDQPASVHVSRAAGGGLAAFDVADDDVHGFFEHPIVASALAHRWCWLRSLDRFVAIERSPAAHQS